VRNAWVRSCEADASILRRFDSDCNTSSHLPGNIRQRSETIVMLQPEYLLGKRRLRYNIAKLSLARATGRASDAFSEMLKTH
jgi:hypothetical protein